MRKYLILLVVFIASFVTHSHAQIKNIKVNSSLASQPNEVSIAVNPTNPNYLAAGSNLKYLYLSSDGGKTWATHVMSSSLGVWGDPCLIYDATGKLFFGHLSDQRGIGNGYWIDRIVVQKSIDNGNSWDDGVGVGFTPPSKQQDKEWLGVDLTNSIYRNNLYMAWTEFDKYGSSDPADKSRILFSRSTNNGTTWSAPFKISDVEGDCRDDDNTVEGAVPCVGPDGEVYVSWSGPSGLKFDKSLNGGVSFGKDVQVANLSAGWAFNIPGINRCNGFPVTACDISNSQYRGNIYINWSDQINGDTDILFSSSNNGGISWSQPKKVNNDNTTRHQFFNWMTVDPKTGIIYIIFYDRRNSSGLETEVYLARSSNGGESFQNFKISESPFTPTSGIFFGDYTNIIAYDGKIYPIWMRMDGTTMSVWMSVINDSDLVTDVKGVEFLVTDYRLFQNYPNPFNPTTIIQFVIPSPSIDGRENLKDFSSTSSPRNDNPWVTLKIYDILGKEVATLVDEYKLPGTYNYEWRIENSELPSGIYYYQLRTSDFSKTNKMILLK